MRSCRDAAGRSYHDALCHTAAIWGTDRHTAFIYNVYMCKRRVSSGADHCPCAAYGGGTVFLSQRLWHDPKCSGGDFPASGGTCSGDFTKAYRGCLSDQKDQNVARGSDCRRCFDFLHTDSGWSDLLADDALKAASCEET